MKTIKIEDLLLKANELLAFTDSKTEYPTTISAEYKEGVCVMIETALHMANRYKGFTHLIPNSEYLSKEWFTRKYY